MSEILPPVESQFLCEALMLNVEQGKPKGGLVECSKSAVSEWKMIEDGESVYTTYRCEDHPEQDPRYTEHELREEF